MPKGWGDRGRQVGILVGVDLIYDFGRGRRRLQPPDAIAHGQQIIDFERSTALALRARTCRQFFLPAHWMIDIANFSST